MAKIQFKPTGDNDSSNLNDLDNLNGTGVVHYEGLPPILNDTPDGRFHGALAASAYGMKATNSMPVESDLSYDSLNPDSYWNLDGYDFLNTRVYFVNNYRQKITELLSIKFKWNGLPNHLRSFQLEQRLIENGQVAIVKFNGYVHAVCFTILEQDIYNNPTRISVDEPETEYDGTIFNEGEFGIIRTNIYGMPPFPKVIRYIRTLDRILFNFERYIQKANGKLFFIDNTLNDSSSSNNVVEDSLQRMITSDKEIVVIKRSLLQGGRIGDILQQIQWDDRSESYIKMINFYEAVILKEIGYLGDTAQKNERKVSGEVATQAMQPIGIFESMLRVRQEDVKIVNEILGLKWSVVANEDLEVELNPEDDPKGVDEFATKSTKTTDND